MTGVEYWLAAVGTAAAVSAIGLAVGMSSLLPTGPLSWFLGIGATVLLIVAAVLQPGLSLILIPAAGLLAAAVIRGVGVGAMSGRVTLDEHAARG